MFHHQQQQHISDGIGLHEDDERDGVLRILDGGGAAHDGVNMYRDDDDFDNDPNADDEEEEGSFASIVNSRRRRQQHHQQRKRRMFALAIVVAVAILAAVVITTTSRSNRASAQLDGGDAAQQPPPQSVTEETQGSPPVAGDNSDADKDDDDDDDDDDDNQDAKATDEDDDDDDDDSSYPAVADDDTNDGDNVLSSSFVVPDEAALESYCGYSLTLSEGFQACEIHCAPSACCRIPTGLDGSCLQDQAGACQVYRNHCAVLDNRPQQQQTSNTDQDSDENGHEGEEGWGVESPSGNNNFGAPQRNSNPNMPDDDHVTDDAEYQYKHIAAAPDDIEEVCSLDSMSASLDGLRACAKYCVNAYCCYDDSPYDCRSKQPHCANYVEPCQRLQAKLQEP